MNHLKAIALFISIVLLAACSSNEVQSGLKTSTDIYLLQRMQNSSLLLYEMSENRAMNLKEASEYEPNKIAKDKLISYLQMGTDFDQASEKLIDKIEATKLEIVKQLGLDLNAKGTIKYEPKGLLSRYQLREADPNKSISPDFDFKTIGEEICTLKYKFRNDILSILLNNTVGSDNKSFTFKDPNIRSKDIHSDEFLSAVEQSFGQMKINYDDAYISMNIYKMVSPDESFFSESFVNNLPWIEQFTLLEDQKQQLFEIRNMVYSLISSKVNLAQLINFNKIVAVTEGDEYVKGGSEQTFKVFVAGVNTFEKPVLTVNGANSPAEVDNGIAKVKVTIPKGASECVFAGTISIHDKAGEIIERPWTKKFVISK